MSDEQLRKYYKIYTDCWKLFKDHSAPGDTDEFWEGLVAKAENICNENGWTEFTREIIIATINEIERVSKQEKKRKV